MLVFIASLVQVLPKYPHLLFLTLNFILQYKFVIVRFQEDTKLGIVSFYFLSSATKFVLVFSLRTILTTAIFVTHYQIPTQL
jgi:hypothetical protein